MHTEEQAKKLWCPMARLVPCSASGEAPIGVAAGYNRGTNGIVIEVPAARCLASLCAMWRWEAAGDPKDCIEAGEMVRGFCGLAGPPEAV